MKIVVGYVSVEGQTRRIAGEIAAHVENSGHAAVIMNIAEMPEYTLERPDRIILCSPIHAGRYPSAFVDFVHREAEWLNAVPSAFVSVTLSIISEDAEERAAARHYPQQLLAETGWKPKSIHDAAGALRFTEYDFFKRWMMKRISRAEGGPVDTARDHEFTDWPKLYGFVDAFLSGVA
jgi:menaquinone-dependent protoporphyrinogen oxidase